MPKNSEPNFTQKEMLIMILERLDDMDEKISSLLEDKVSRKEFYSVLGVLMTFGLILVALV
jgi:precorrin-6B methylase 1